MDGLSLFLSGKDPEDLESLLEMIFWKDKKMALQAKEFIHHIREWALTSSPYRASDWQGYCEKKQISQRRYHSILKRLRAAGMVEKRYNPAGFHEIRVSSRFSKTMKKMAGIWDEQA